VALRTFVLGEFAVSVDDRPPRILHGLPAEVLALLCLDSGSTVPTARIVEQIWAPEPPPNAPARLHVHISRIRRLLQELGCCPNVLLTRNEGYALDVEPEQRDLWVPGTCHLMRPARTRG
jgi:DNA-binding SARP family transcriptional activator